MISYRQIFLQNYLGAKKKNDLSVPDNPQNWQIQVFASRQWSLDGVWQSRVFWGLFILNGRRNGRRIKDGEVPTLLVGLLVCLLAFGFVGCSL